MEREDKILNFIDGRATSDECRELIKNLHREGSLGEVLLTDAATLCLYSREELLEYFPPAEVDEIEKKIAALLGDDKDSVKLYNDTGDDLRMVAEDEESYGK